MAPSIPPLGQATRQDPHGFTFLLSVSLCLSNLSPSPASSMQMLGCELWASYHPSFPGTKPLYCLCHQRRNNPSSAVNNPPTAEHWQAELGTSIILTVFLQL